MKTFNYPFVLDETLTPFDIKQLKEQVLLESSVVQDHRSKAPKVMGTNLNAYTKSNLGKSNKVPYLKKLKLSTNNDFGTDQKLSPRMSEFYKHNKR